LRIVTGCLRPTPADNLPILAGIQPAELRHTGATLSLARRAMEPEHLLHSALTCPPKGMHTGADLGGGCRGCIPPTTHKEVLT